jgi:hypothetical protein
VPDNEIWADSTCTVTAFYQDLTHLFACPALKRRLACDSFTMKMPDQSSIEVVIQLERNDVTRANMDIALGRFTPYKWLTLGISSALLSAMFAVELFPQIMRSPDRWLEILLVGLVGLIGWPAIFVVAIRLISRKAAKSLLQSTPSLQGPTHWLFSDGGIRVDSPTASSQAL